MHPAREKLLRNREFILLYSIVGEQQPAGESLFECVRSVATGGLSYLSKQRIGETQEKIEQQAILLYFGFQVTRRHFQRLAVGLDQRLLWRGFGPEDDRSSHPSLPAHDTRFHGYSILESREHSDNPRG